MSQNKYIEIWKYHFFTNTLKNFYNHYSISERIDWFTELVFIECLLSDAKNSSDQMQSIQRRNDIWETIENVMKHLDGAVLTP